MSDINVQIVQASNYRAVDSIIGDMSLIIQNCSKGGMTLVPSDFFADCYRMVLKLRRDNEKLEKKHNDAIMAMLAAKEYADRIVLPRCCLDCTKKYLPEERTDAD